MLKLLVSTLLLAAPLPTAAGGSPLADGHVPSLHITDGAVFLDGERIYGPFSVQQTRFGYLYLYLPGRGLYTIGGDAFEGAEQAGEFQGRNLTFSMGGSEVRLESSTLILSSRRSDAWVRYEPNFKLNVQGVLYGYGDHPSVAEQWLKRFGPPAQ